MGTVPQRGQEGLFVPIVRGPEHPGKSRRLFQGGWEADQFLAQRGVIRGFGGPDRVAERIGIYGP